MIIYILLGLFVLSLVLAIFSMKDFNMPRELKKMLAGRKIKGSIVFFKDNKVKHYSGGGKR